MLYNSFCCERATPIEYLGVAQFGSVLEWGSRGRRFESSHPDHLQVLKSQWFQDLCFVKMEFDHAWNVCDHRSHSKALTECKLQNPSGYRGSQRHLALAPHFFISGHAIRHARGMPFVLRVASRSRAPVPQCHVLLQRQGQHAVLMQCAAQQLLRIGILHHQLAALDAIIQLHALPV